MGQPEISTEEYANRIQSARRQLGAEGLDALIVTDEEDIYYLTGLTYKSLERLFMMVITQKQIIFILPKMELAHLQHVNHVDRIVYYWEYPANSPERWQDVLHEVTSGSTIIGLSSKCPYEISAFLEDVNLQVKECNLVEKLRWIKSKTEINLIKRACYYCDQAVSMINSKAYYGMTELEVFSIGSSIQKKLIKETDFDYLASSVLVAAWPGRISHQPHGVPSVGDVLKEGSHISLALLRLNGYAAELERTFFTSEPNKTQQELFSVMLEARRRSYAVLKPGIKTEEVDFASKHFLEKEGFKDHLMHRTGHGIGLGNHEGPYLAEGDETVLKENMVVSIEPGIYIEGVGGFRHSDTVRITSDGYEVLTRCPDDIQNLTYTQFRPFQKMKGKLIKKMFRL